MGFAPQFTARTDLRNGVASIALIGELDLATVPIVEEDLARFEREGVDTIMLDLRDLTFLDCSALHAFLRARDRAKANGHQLLLVGASRCVRRLFELAGTEFLMDDPDALGVLDRFTRSQTSWQGRAAVAGVDAAVVHV